MASNSSWFEDLEVRRDVCWAVSLIPAAMFLILLYFTNVTVGYLGSKPPLSQTGMDNANKMTFEVLLFTGGVYSICTLASIFFADVGHVTAFILRDES